jgi:HK97 gp10 family phage protein
MSLEVQGFTELEAMLKSLPQDMENRVLQSATTASMRAIVADVAADAPTSLDQSPASRKYGKLRDNILKSVRSKRRKTAGSRGAVISTRNAFWGRFIEYGTRYMEAKPFFSESFKRHTPKALEVLKERLGKGIERQMKKMLK